MCEQEIVLTEHQDKVSEIVRSWWIEWLKISFPLFLPRSKWSQRQQDLKEGDIVLLKYDRKYSTSLYRLARVLVVHPDVHGTVRTVTIGLRDNKGKSMEQWNRCSTLLVEMVVGVQRLVVVLPTEEQQESIDELHDESSKDFTTSSGEDEDLSLLSPAWQDNNSTRKSRRLQNLPPLWEQEEEICMITEKPGRRIPSPSRVSNQREQREHMAERFGLLDVRDEEE